MAADKKDYQSVLGALVDYGTLASIINKLNRVLIATEDTDLNKLIEPVVARVDKVLRDLPNGKKSVRASLRQQLKVEGLAVDAPPEQVGELAAQQSVVLHGLVGTADLEQAFFRIIEEAGPSERPASAEEALS